MLFSEGKSDLSEITSWLEFIECLANDVYKIDLHKNNIPSRKGIALFVIYSIFVIRSMFFLDFIVSIETRTIFPILLNVF